MPLYFLILSSGLNVFLDIVFIVPMKLGVIGAALATVLSQGVSGIFCLIFIWKRIPQLHLRKSDFRISRELLISEIKIGVPMSLPYVVTSVGMLVIQASLNLLGTLAVTAYSVGNKVDVILEQGPIAIGTTMSTYCAQNLGAGNIQRIKKGVKAAIWIMAVYWFILGIPVAFLGKNFTGFFIGGDVSGIIGDVDVFLKVISVSGILLGLLCIFRNSVQGMGGGMISLAGGVLELAARIVIALVTLHFRTFFSVCLGYPASWLLAAIFFMAVYLVYVKKQMNLE